MKLPPSIQAIVDEGPGEGWIQRIAHEACRLQREADINEFDQRWGDNAFGIRFPGAPLVVPSTEDKE